MDAGNEGGSFVRAAAHRSVLVVARQTVNRRMGTLLDKYLSPKKKDKLPKLVRMPTKMPRSRMPVAYWAHLRVFRLWCLGSYSFGTPLLKVGSLRHVLAIVDTYLQTVSQTHKQRTAHSTQHPPTYTHTRSSDTTSTLALRNSAQPPPKLSCGRNGMGTSNLCRTRGTSVQCWTGQVKPSSKSMGSKVATRVRRGCSGFAPLHRC